MDISNNLQLSCFLPFTFSSSLCPPLQKEEKELVKIPNHKMADSQHSQLFPESREKLPTSDCASSSYNFSAWTGELVILLC